jgi:hypothetical protein
VTRAIKPRSTHVLGRPRPLMIEFGWGRAGRGSSTGLRPGVLWSARGWRLGGQVVAGAGGPQTRVNSSVHAVTRTPDIAVG